MARAVTITGRARLDQKLKMLPERVVKHIRSEMEIAAGQIVEAMKQAAPVDEGDLRDSIGWTWGRPPAGASIVAQVKSKLGDQLTLSIYAGGGRAYYASFIELGTRKMPAQPFFYTTWKSVNKGRGNPKARVRRAVREAAKAVASGG